MKWDDSCWLINYKNGYKIILSEKQYGEYKKTMPTEYTLSEEHWFIAELCTNKNPDIEILE